MTSRLLPGLIAVTFLLLAGCTPPNLLDPNAATTDGAASLTGRISTTQTTKLIARAEVATPVYQVLAQSSATGTVYRADADAAGNFDINLPDTEAGHSFMVTILGPDGKAVGPVIFARNGDEGVTAVTPDGPTSLGTLDLPTDPTQTPIEPGTDANLAGLTDNAVTARLAAQGVPVGVATYGKGETARNRNGLGNGLIDADRDGLIDVLDADDDGDGVIDDVDGGVDAGTTAADARFGCFMNLKISADQAPTYYDGTAAEIATALATDTIITFEVVAEPGATRTVTAAELLETPGPAYLPTADVVADGLKTTTWASVGYELTFRADLGDRFDAFLRPNAVMGAGDTFTVDITYDDGTTEQQSRMLNFIFKNIPKLTQYGTPSTLDAFDVGDATINGTEQHPIPLCSSEDLVLVFNPPLDETGAYLTGFDYDFAIFYLHAADNTQLNGEMDYDATWTTPVTGFDRGTYRISAADLTLAADNTYTVTLPLELFPDTVALTTGGSAAVGGYKIDITAECTSGNAAIMLAFQK